MKVAIPRIHELLCFLFDDYAVVLVKVNGRHSLLPPLLHYILTFDFVHGISELVIPLEVCNFAL